MVACVGEVSESLLAGLAQSPNIALARPPDADPDPLAAAALAAWRARKFGLPDY